MNAPITDAHAIRIAKRLARNAHKQDRLLSRGIVRRLWALLDAHPLARAAYGRPPDKHLAEHVETFEPDELDAAVENLIEATRSVVASAEATDG